MNLADQRKEYQRQTLDESHISANPVEQFANWLADAQQNPQILEANVMHLATVSADHKPTIRVVLLKGLEDGTFVFFTNYESRKGQELAQNDAACLNFYWDALERQVRIEGKVEKISAAQSEHYYNSRPLASRIGAIVSPQSKPVAKDFLEKQFEQLSQVYTENNLPKKPENWGGYRLLPDYFEFWQGRPSRLHDRIVYEKNDQNWTIKRIAP